MKTCVTLQNGKQHAPVLYLILEFTEVPVSIKTLQHDPITPNAIVIINPFEQKARDEIKQSKKSARTYPEYVDMVFGEKSTLKGNTRQ